MIDLTEAPPPSAAWARLKRLVAAALALTLLFNANALSAAAGDAAKIEAGRTLALKICAKCHVVADGQPAPVLPFSPARGRAPGERHGAVRLDRLADGRGDRLPHEPSAAIKIHLSLLYTRKRISDRCFVLGVACASFRRLARPCASTDN